jgi:hypothetical protein
MDRITEDLVLRMGISCKKGMGFKENYQFVRMGKYELSLGGECFLLINEIIPD